jgi:ribosomal protein S18 acetylase RimI-like enzyme
MKLYKTTDYQRLALMDSQLFPDDYPVVDWNQCVWFIGIENGVDVCYCGIKMYDNVAYLSRAGVMPGSQGRGFQRKMIKKRLEYARKNDVDRIVTDTVVSNIASNNNLMKMGFRMYNPGDAGWKNPHDSLIYWELEWPVK